MEPTEGERANGWTAESLTAYLRQRDREQASYAGSKRERRDKAPRRAAGDYDPFRW